MIDILSHKINQNEAYLDDSKEYYDYHTETYTGDGNVIDTNHTGISYYDQFLDSTKRKYLHDNKNLDGNIVSMTPKEYYELCARKIFNTSVEKLKRERGEYDRSIIDKLHNVLLKFKKKLCMPMINYADTGQEGLHRMLAIAELFGWDYKVPVLVVDYYDKERAKREEAELQKREIDKKVKQAILNTLEFNFSDKEDLETQLFWELERQFRYNENIKVPETITLEDTFSTYTFSFAEYEYEINKDQIRWDEETDFESEITDIDLDDFVEDKDFLKQYFGEDWKKNRSYPTSIFNIKEDIEPHKLDRESIINVIEDCSNYYYQDSSVALKLICETLYHDHSIDARYEGRSIYVGHQKVATIKVERVEQKLLSVSGYTLFI